MSHVVVRIERGALRKAKQAIVRTALKMAAGNRTEAARILGITRQSYIRMLGAL